jgi:glycosyltransferase involved in cell wall biosynthesis/phenylacetate-coenzyme A ligase PaaK-like adenylate-forming protein
VTEDFSRPVRSGDGRIGVLQVVDSLFLGGAERVAVNLANLLPRDRYAAHLCVTRQEGPLAPEVAPHVERLVLDRLPRWDDPAAAWRLARYIRRHHIRIVHAHDDSVVLSTAAMLLARGDRRLVWHDHFGRLEIKARSALLYRALTARVDGTLSVTRALAAWAIGSLGHPSDRVWYMPNFVHCAPFRSIPQLPGTPGRRIVCVGRIVPQKDHVNLVRALPRILQQVPDAHVIIVGADSLLEYADVVRREIRKQGVEKNISLLGARTDVPDVVRACDIGVLSSASEGLPLTLIEYGMCGLPSVSTRVGECAEVMADGKVGILVPPSDPVALADGLIRLLESPDERVRLGKLAQQHAEDHHSEQVFLRRLDAVYETLLGPLRERARTVPTVGAPVDAVPRIRRLYGLLDRVQRRAVVARFEESVERQGWKAEELAHYAGSRRRRMLAHCLREVPFYRERLSRLSNDPDELAGPLFEEIPSLEKSDIAAAPEQLLARGRRSDEAGITEVTSGGTSGPPTRILLDRDTVDAHTAATLRSFLWFGADPTGRNVMLWGPPPDENTYASLSGRLKGWVLGRTLMPTYGIDDAQARRYLERLLGTDLDFVAGYSSALVQLAAAARPGERCRVRAGVIPAAEPIFDFQRGPVERVFGAPVRERYGCNEFSLIAQECPRGSLHVATDRVHLEIVGPDGKPVAPGEIGTVLVTDLDNDLMPLVRYRIGDLAAWGSSCDCGLAFPVLDRVHGRLGDALAAPDGGIQSPHALAEALKGSAARGLQLVVDEAGLIVEVRLLAEPFPVDDLIERWRPLTLGSVFDVRFVENLERSSSGKVLPVIRRGGPPPSS